MISAEDFLAPAIARGYTFFTGVPCSFLTSLIDLVIADRRLDYVAAASEGEAVAIAAGAWLAGRKTVVMCQNSGLGNAVNPLTSLNFPFRIPSLLLVTWRGQPGVADEPQHELMGQITQGLLAMIRVRHLPFPKRADDIGFALDAAEAAMQADELPFAFVLEKGTIAEGEATSPAMPARSRGEYVNRNKGGKLPSRIDLLRSIQAHAPGDAAVVVTTGKSGRELFTLEDRPRQIYQVGSMGCASAMALGIAVNSERPVVAIDGDGAALMKMGNLATIGQYGPHNLVHVILDNGVHDSTGGQNTVSSSIDFAAVAVGSGYRRGIAVDGLEAFETAFTSAFSETGPHLIHVRIAPGSLQKLGRPTVTPREVARRLRAFLRSSD